jgi:hypothetical protein
VSYTLLYTPTAERDLEKVQAGLLDFVEQQLLRLAESPASVSVPSVLPFPPNCQMFRFAHPDFEGSRWNFVVLFRYGADEQSLHILGVGRYPSVRPE